MILITVRTDTSNSNVTMSGGDRTYTEESEDLQESVAGKSDSTNRHKRSTLKKSLLEPETCVKEIVKIENV